MLAPDSQIARDTSQMLQGEAVVYSELLRKIEYLEGFDTNIYRTSTLSPLWKPLTLDEYRANTSKNLLCRIVPTEYNSLGIRTANTGVPVFDSFFVIKPIAAYTIASPSLVITQPEVTPDAIIASYRANIAAAYDELREAISDLADTLISMDAHARTIESLESHERNSFADEHIRRSRISYNSHGHRARSQTNSVNSIAEQIKMLYSEVSAYIPE